MRAFHKMVPGAGLEPARFSARDFKSLVSTNSTTRALLSFRQKSKDKGVFFIVGHW